MNTDDFLRLVTHVVFVALFAILAQRAAKVRSDVNRDTALLFGAVALFIACYWIARLLRLEPDHWLRRGAPILVLALPYLLLRLAQNFTAVRPLWMRAAEGYLVVSGIGLLITGRQPGLALLILIVAGFVLGSGLAAWLFWRAGTGSSGVTQRRARLVAAGIGLLGITIVFGALGAAAPRIAPATTLLTQLLSLATGLAFYLGFATPAALRHAWQEPELRQFLGRTSKLISLADPARALRELSQAAAAALGARQGVIGLLDASGENLMFRTREGGMRAFTLADAVSGRALIEDRPVFWRGDRHSSPGHMALFQQHGIKVLLAAPIATAEKRYGVLSVFSEHGSLFEEDDLALLALLAGHAAVILEARVLVEQATSVRAREESARSKEDFLSAAAHDLRNPLSTIVAQAHVLEMKAARSPEAADLEGVRRLLREALHLRDLIAELLDAASAEAGRIVGKRQRADLGALASEVRNQLPELAERVVLRVSPGIPVDVDPVRIAQLVRNLLQNAAKYSPGGEAIELEVHKLGGEARIAVRDRGIGIPEQDLPSIFERFHRGANVDDRRFPGMGLGLFICKAIVDQHGGRIWVESAAGAGTCIHVALPAVEEGGA